MCDQGVAFASPTKHTQHKRHKEISFGVSMITASKEVVLVALVVSFHSVATNAFVCSELPSLRCVSTIGNLPTLDGDLSDWQDVEGIQTNLRSTFGSMYPNGPATFKCLYDTERIYFALDIPGDYRFDAGDNHLCAAIGTMFKIGPEATFYNMGGCNNVFSGCREAVPERCDNHRVDLGAHWELRTTEQGVLYTGNERSGDDAVGNKDDEYSVSPYCRFDDDDTMAANEWDGAWSHTTSETGAPGSYLFELSRKLATASSMTDAQLPIGGTYQFGVAFWDPYEREDGGWTDAGHYLTGCATEWIDLTLDATAQRQAPSIDTSDPQVNLVPGGVFPQPPSPPSFPPPTSATFPPPTPTVFRPPTSVPPPPPTQESCSVPEKLTCNPISTAPPVLDGQLTEWASIQGLASEIHSIFGTTYDVGSVSYKCQYDTEKIYFALEIPGEYRFNTTDNHFCAAIGTMFKVGSQATFLNMGGCPDAMGGCPDGVPPQCRDYLVDLGAHWELRTTQQGVLYPINDSTGSGNDLVANNDDEYGVSSFCRFDDDDMFAANDWEGAWTHSNPVEDGAMGSYRFEIARSLYTISTVTDQQLTAGQTYSFGIAYWDPYETEEGGWSDAGHYLTGCASEWIDLELLPDESFPDPSLSAPTTSRSCSVPSSLVCAEAISAPKLDGELDEWMSVDGLESEIHSIFGTTYEMGQVSYKCLYDAQNIYFALEIPGEYRFNTTDNHFCAAIGTMFKIGSKAAYINMGGCPDAMTGCIDGVPDQCADYLVDLGAHWELRTTQQGVMYPFDDTTGSGNDLVANNDDEYGVSPFCRFDDDGVLAANEWSGAWTHSNSVDGGLGSYAFEISRPLLTASSVTDKQLEVDRTYSFGIAYWDPFESEENGWSDAGHYLTGCASEWIDLTLGGSDPPTMTAQEPPRTEGACSVPETLTCEETLLTPVLDGQLEEWSSISGLESEIHSIYGGTYDMGTVSYKCQYDAEKIYFALEIPGDYRFNTTDNHFCAAIGTMFKIGAKAAFVNMGGCPDALSGCADGVPPECTDYLVDLGAHWELRTTQQGILYPMNAATGSGNDLVANNDDEYGVSSFCRFDDDDAMAANDWEGSWSHSNPIDGEVGFYKFEIARSLVTASTATDKQLEAGNTYSFGIAYWDPFETEEAGWSDAGHFLTGCGNQWIDLRLGRTSTVFPPGTDEPGQPTTSQSCSVPQSLVCRPSVIPPVLDGQVNDWEVIEGLNSEIHSIFGTTYEMGQVSYKCQYDSQKIYFALEIPGDYRFNSTDNHFCAAIGTMFKIGSKAAYINMGGCPDALAGCSEGVPPECADYLVDLGAHWELRTTEQGVLYPINDSTGSGNDLVANNDDEYGVSPFCRFDDNDMFAANDWEGAWSHSNPTEGGAGVYKFEIARSLSTLSTVSDKQLEVGMTYSFGIAYWDPYETEEGGWSDAGHYLTGCASEWIDLILGATPSSIAGTSVDMIEDTVGEAKSPSSSTSKTFSGTCVILAFQVLASFLLSWR